jgi:indolepyruvate decarboxylase
MCLAAPENRTVMVTGDGAHQMTANELGTMSRYGAMPILIVLNNTSYAVEELISETTGHRYNILAPWRYADLPLTLGCQDWYAVRVTTLGELEQALETASRGDRAVYIEVVIDPAEQPHPLPSEMLDKLYRLTPRDRG